MNYNLVEMFSSIDYQVMTLIAARLSAGLTRISTDTRSIQAGDVFIAIKGANHDGHDYIDAALAAGAELVIAERGRMGIATATASPRDDKCHPERSEGSLGADAAVIASPQGEAIHRVLYVDSAIAAYQLLAKTYRRLVNPTVVAITGSSGKTTTKEMMRLVLSQRYRVHYTSANLNNEIGVPQTVVAMPADTEVLVLEMGMRGLGQIQELSVCAEPNISVITNIGTAHIELLGSVENIRKAKLEIVSGMVAREDLAPLLAVDAFLYETLTANPDLLKPHVETKGADWKLNVMGFDAARRFTINGLAGAAIHSDANAVATVAQVLGLSENEIQAGLLEYNPGRGSGSYHHDARGNLIIDDSYNANPDSLRASVGAVCEQFSERVKILVLGELKESSPELVDAAVTYVSSHIDILIDARGRSIEDVIEELRAKLVGLNNAVVLVKGSRVSQLERVVDEVVWCL